MFPHVFLLQATWRHGRRWMRSGRQRSRGPKSTRSSNKHMREITRKWTRSKGLPDDTWWRQKHPIFIAEWSSWIIRTHWNPINPDSLIFIRRVEINNGVVWSWTTSGAGDHHQTVSMEATWTHLSLWQKSDTRSKVTNGPRSHEIRRLTGFADSWHAIVARSRRNRGTVELRSWLLRREILAHDCSEIVATIWLQTRSNGHNFRAKISFKKTMYPSFKKFWLIRETIKRIWRKILSSS